MDASQNYQQAQKNTTNEDSGVMYMARDDNDSSIKEQIKANLSLLNSMKIVGSVEDSTVFKYNQKTLDWVLKKLENTGYKVNRKGFGVILLDKRRIKRGLSYLKTDAERIAFILVPDVLREGVEISKHLRHKGRPYDTVTFAAPVMINNQRGNMAVVVRQDENNYYKVHRLLMPDGS